MADIKTRDARRGEVKTIDRAAIASHRMKNAAIRAKENTISERRSDERSSSSFAVDESMRSSESVAIHAVEGAKREYAKKRINSRLRRTEGAETGFDYGDFYGKGADFGESYFSDSKTVGNSVMPERSRSPKRIMRRGNNAQNTQVKTVRISRVNNSPKSANLQSRTYENQRSYGIRKLQRKTAIGENRRIISNSGGLRKAGAKGVKGAGSIIKGAAVATKTLITAIAAAGSSAIVIILICIFLSASVYLFGQDTNDDFSAEALGTGDTLITRVASAQLGNVGGLKFCRWYGFNGRVEWCAVFVSWCANQCGYIDKGIIPKFAVVGDGIDWFKARNQFRNNKYIPHPGDIIFFDWDADGTRDHVGLVERCDGKMVYTIEGNSGDVCRRLAYRVGHPEVIGYGIPTYPAPQRSQKSPKTATEETTKTETKTQR